jgi:hypothetical protein
MYLILVIAAAASLLAAVYIPIIALSHGFSLGIGALAVGLLAVVNGTGRSMAGRLSDRYGRRRTPATSDRSSAPVQVPVVTHVTGSAASTVTQPQSPMFQASTPASPVWSPTTSVSQVPYAISVWCTAPSYSAD